MTLHKTFDMVVKKKSLQSLENRKLLSFALFAKKMQKVFNFLHFRAKSSQFLNSLEQICTFSYLLVISGPRRGPADTSQFFSEGKGKSVKDEAGERSSPGLSRSTFTLPSARAKPEPVIAGRRPAIEYLCILRFKNIFIN